MSENADTQAAIWRMSTAGAGDILLLQNRNVPTSVLPSEPPDTHLAECGAGFSSLV